MDNTKFGEAMNEFDKWGIKIEAFFLNSEVAGFTKMLKAANDKKLGAQCVAWTTTGQTMAALSHRRDLSALLSTGPSQEPPRQGSNGAPPWKLFKSKDGKCFAAGREVAPGNFEVVSMTAADHKLCMKDPDHISTLSKLFKGTSMTKLARQAGYKGTNVNQLFSRLKDSSGPQKELPANPWKLHSKYSIAVQMQPSATDKFVVCKLDPDQHTMLSSDWSHEPVGEEFRGTEPEAVLKAAGVTVPGKFASDRKREAERIFKFPKAWEKLGRKGWRDVGPEQESDHLDGRRTMPLQPPQPKKRIDREDGEEEQAESDPKKSKADRVDEETGNDNYNGAHDQGRILREFGFGQGARTPPLPTSPLPRRASFSEHEEDDSAAGSNSSDSNFSGDASD
jgi:hypothetical protein